MSTIPSRFLRLRNFALRHERWLVYFYLTGGFIFDAIFFRRVDLFFENFAIIAHLALGALAIIAIHMEKEKKGRLKGTHAFLPLVMQFAIGGLFGKFVIFYSRSGALVRSWPFLLIMIILFVGNEFVRERYAVLNFRISLFFIALFSYCIFFVPVLTKEIGAVQFIESGAVSLGIMVLILVALRYLAKDITSTQWLRLVAVVVCIYLIFNGLYFTNSIPPIPLALKDAAIYHSIERQSDGGYIARGEDQPWLSLAPEVVHWDDNETLYLWASIFAPTGLSTRITHRWQFLKDGTWETTSVISMDISGGREGGYRGYTSKRRVAPGQWRVDLETDRGQLLGRIPFTVVEASSTPPLLTQEL